MAALASGAAAAAGWPPAVLDAMTGAHEARPHGVGDGVDWAKGPRVGMGNTVPKGWNALTAWGQVYLAADAAPPLNVRVEVRDLACWMLRKSDRRWVAVQSATLVEGAAYREDFAGDANVPIDRRIEPDGGISVRLQAGSNFHFWPDSGRATIDPTEISGLVVTYRARLVRDDTRRPARFAKARIVAGAGGDYWQSPTVAWNQWTTNGDFAIGKFRLLTGEWRLIAAHTFAPADLEALQAAGGP